MAGQQADATLMNFLLGAGGLWLRGAGLSNGQGGTLGGSLASGLGSLGSGLGSGISSLLGAI